MQMVVVSGNLKVKLPPSKGDLEVVEPSVIGFIGECHRMFSSGYGSSHYIVHMDEDSAAKVNFRR